MSSFSPFFSSNLQWENTPWPLPSNPNNFHIDNNHNICNMKSDYVVPIFSLSFQAPEGEDQDLQFVDRAGQVGLGLEDSPRSQQKSASSAHESRHGYSELAKNLNHNGRERDRRKRINASYSALRALLPAPLHQKIEERPNDIVKCETLNEELLAMVEGGAQARRSDPLLVNKKEPRSDLITFDPYPI
ncbi:hypothetical protein Cgig2_020465 [Carnegiea gigantea]|uniref:BHLH domain-containing protein n=1 Tax=Carnegiea gigantea TaxID=171969 RepID=A0A9Q1JJ03_9CARY|nr:hypothetical protein Cgig2_020465 [Carnegiea gigantea]